MTTRSTWFLFAALVAGLVACGPTAEAAPRPATASLTPEGEKLAADHAGMLESLRAEIVKSLPGIDEAKKTAFLAARAEYSGLKAPSDKSPDAKRKYTEALAQADENALRIAREILASIDGFLASDALDGPLMRAAILAHGTPQGLAEFAQQGEAEAKLIEKLLGDEPLMRQVLEAGGANGGEYGEMMQVYTAILEASERAREPGTMFQRLALGTAIHMPWMPGKNKGIVPGITYSSQDTIDQVSRYLHYEKAYLDGELDPAFKDMNTWECRFITDDPYSNEDLAWVRQMIRTYRPDHVSTPDYKWRYVRIVKSDVPYISPTDDPSLGSPAQQHIALGGICGRRAYFGRLAGRAFGIPCRASTQTGHGAMCHWTPDGWVICFGAGWSVAWCGPQGGLDFLLDSQAREFTDDYKKVVRAQWIGDALGEKDVNIGPGQVGTGGGFWDGLAYCKKQAIVKDAEVKALELMGGMKLGESDELMGDEVGAEIEIPDESKEIVVESDGTFIIPAVACSSPKKSSDRILFMENETGGYQLHYSRLGAQPELVKYRVEVPAAGDYELAAEVSTVAPKQQILVRLNREEPAPFDLPFTKGAWETTKPLKVSLAEGRNTISITARAPNRGVSINRFRLTPVK